MINEYYEQSYQEWLENYDENNPYDLHTRGLISCDDLKSWLKKDEKEKIFEKRKIITNKILNILKINE